jgi:VIT1/CCC1 family predicted Fe2+/Mn2+ transporter
MPADPAHDATTTDELIAAHRPDVIQRRLHAGASHSYLRDFVYGAIDGAVTTFAVVSGVAGAGLSPGVLVVLGVANLVGDGFSMAAGNYLSTQAEAQQRERLRRMEERHIDIVPDGEREEVRQIIAGYGVRDAALEQAVATVTADRGRWIDVMLREEHGVAASQSQPMIAATVTFTAFLLVGLIPLTPFLINLLRNGLVSAPFAASTGLTGTAFFLVGAVKSRFVDEHWLRAGLTTLVVGGLAAGLAYLLGAALHGVVA